jgi:hypothetical protein
MEIVARLTFPYGPHQYAEFACRANREGLEMMKENDSRNLVLVRHPPVTVPKEEHNKRIRESRQREYAVRVDPLTMQITRMRDMEEPADDIAAVEKRRSEEISKIKQEFPYE